MHTESFHVPWTCFDSSCSLSIILPISMNSPANYQHYSSTFNQITLHCSGGTPQKFEEQETLYLRMCCLLYRYAPFNVRPSKGKIFEDGEKRRVTKHLWKFVRKSTKAVKRPHNGKIIAAKYPPPPFITYTTTLLTERRHTYTLTILQCSL